MARWKNGSQAASLIRHVIEDFHKSGTNFSWKKPEMKSKQKTNTEKASTLRLEALQEQYKGGERSLEESARLVGLKIPVSKSEQLHKFV
ncbi:Protein FMC1 [Dirofilaria immitis]